MVKAKKNKEPPPAAGGDELLGVLRRRTYRARLNPPQPDGLFLSAREANLTAPKQSRVLDPSGHRFAAAQRARAR